MSAVPIDFNRPDIVPPFESKLFGLLVGCAFSASGAILGTWVCRKCDGDVNYEVGARAVNNIPL